MRILICSIRHVCLHEGGNRINGFTIHEKGCCLGEGKAVPRGMCEYVCSLKSTIPGVSFVPHKELWLCSVPALRHRWSLGQRNSIPQLTTTGLCSPRSDKSTKIKLKKKKQKRKKCSRLQLPPELSFWGRQPRSQSNEATPPARTQRPSCWALGGDYPNRVRSYGKVGPARFFFKKKRFVAAFNLPFH